MRYLLEQFPSVSSSERQSLASLEIITTDQLLSRVAQPSARETLARQSGLSYERLTQLVGLADLVRVKGIGPSLSEILVYSGTAGNIQQLVERSGDLHSLRQELVRYGKQNNRISRLVSINRLDGICEEARELRPRLLLLTLKPDLDFRRDLFERAWTERKHSFKLSLGMFSAVLVPIAILAIVIHFVIQTLQQEPFSPYEDLNQIYLSIEQIRLGLLDRSVLAIVIILVVLLFILIVLYDVINYMQATWLVLFLFPTFSQQEFYKKVNSIDIKKQVRTLWWMVAMLAVLGFVLVATAINLFVYNSVVDDGILFERFSQIIIPGGIFMGVVASMPVLSFFIKEFPAKREYNQEHVRRYFVYYMFKIMMLPIMVVIFTQVVMPSAFTIHTGLMSTRFIPQARAEIAEKREELMEMQSDDLDKMIWRDYALSIVDYSVLPEIGTQVLVITPDDSSVMDIIIPAALNMVVWIALTALLLLFVVPYLILGGLGRGLFYMVVLGVSFALENKLTIVAPTWFRLPNGSISQGPFIAFFIFINALFFDWIFDVFTNRKKICPACKTEMETTSLFCSQCGFQQK